MSPKRILAVLLAVPLCVAAQAQQAPASPSSGATTNADLQREVQELKARVDDLERKLAFKNAPNDAAAKALQGAVAAEAATPAVGAKTAPQPPDEQTPFAFADFTWLNGNSRIDKPPVDTEFFTPEIRSDVSYTYDWRHPKDDTVSGSSEVFRSNEVQLTDFAAGGDFHYDNVHARVMTQFGLYSQTTPRNDASPARGQWDLADALRYVSEAYGGYHWNKLHGVNVDAGIFMSYIGLFSYYNFDSWGYQPSYVSSNTPWFFQGLRLQMFPTNKLKIEPWFVNGWQSYGRFNNRPGLGGEVLYRPTGRLSLVFNQYALGRDTLGVQQRTRYHEDDSVQYLYYQHKGAALDRAAFSVTGDAGCETGGGVSCFGDGKSGPKQSFLGFMVYNRLWFDKDRYGVTMGGGKINNPGRYLVLLPPINGATATSGTPYFTENPGDPYKAYDASFTFDYMPSQYFTYRTEYNYRAASVPYFSGPGGVTPPGGNTGAPGSLVPGWTPDLRRNENRATAAILVMF